jgi:uncharacterized small protein (DUF1192 family)
MSQGNMMKFIPVEASKWGEMVQAMTRVKELEEALANLKAERDQLKADLEKSDGVVWTLSVENARLKAEVERLTKAGDMCDQLLACFEMEGRRGVNIGRDMWREAKGVQS